MDKDDNDPYSGFRVQVSEFSFPVIVGGEQLTFMMDGILDVGDLGSESFGVSFDDLVITMASSSFEIAVELDYSMTLSRRSFQGGTIRIDGDIALSWQFDCASAQGNAKELCELGVRDLGSRGNFKLNISSNGIEYNTNGCITGGTIGLRDSAGNQVAVVYSACGQAVVTYNGALLL